MNKRIIIILLIFISTTALSGCGFVADGPFGWVYTDHTTPIAIGPAGSGSKVGKACIHSFFGAISIGDASIEEAMKDGNVNEIFSVNKANLSIFGTYTRQCTIVRGE